MLRESVNPAKQKENESNEKLNMFNLEIYARVVFYGLMIGFIYNYVYFNICLDFNILDVIESNELLFSWLGTSSLLATVIVLFLTYILVKFAKDFTLRTFWILLIVSLIALGSTILCFKYDCIKISSDIYLAIMMFEAMTITISFMYLYRPIEVINSKIIRIEGIIVVSIIAFTIVYAATEKDKLIHNKQQIRISFKSDYANKSYQNKDLYYIGKTVNVVIATEEIPPTEEIKSFITFYMSDISSIKFLPKNK